MSPSSFMPSYTALPMARESLLWLLPFWNVFMTSITCRDCITTNTILATVVKGGVTICSGLLSSRHFSQHNPPNRAFAVCNPYNTMHCSSAPGYFWACPFLFALTPAASLQMLQVSAKCIEQWVLDHHVCVCVWSALKEPVANWPVYLWKAIAGAV